MTRANPALTTRSDRTDALLCVLIVALFAAAVALAFVAQGRKAPTRPTRPPISNASTYAQVLRNFTGRPYSTGAYVTGYRCAGYTAGKDGHGWVVIRCRK